MADAGILKDILNFGSFGLVAWLFIHTYTKLIPSLQERLDRLIERFEKALEQQHGECAEVLTRQQQKFDEVLAAYRDFARQEITTVARAYEQRSPTSGKSQP